MCSTWIKSSDALNKVDYEFINKLEKTCTTKDRVGLKLELDYKLDMEESSMVEQQLFIGIKKIKHYLNITKKTVDIFYNSFYNNFALIF